MNRRQFLKMMALAGASALAGCDAGAEEHMNNAILITIETLRRDHCSLYGYKRDTTPFMRELARECAVFDDAWSMSSWTKPSMASIYTGLYPSQHGCHTFRSQLPDDVPTIQSVLKEHGYSTAAFWTSRTVSDPRYLYGRGFDTFISEGNGTRFEVLREHAIEWLETAKTPFLLSLHTFDPHSPYEPPGAYDRYLPGDYPILQVPNWQSKYDGEIAYTDAVLGEFVGDLKERGLWESSLVLITSDHGEGFLEHSRVGHGGPLFPELLRVPLLLKLPAAEHGGTRISGKTCAVDLMPTVLGVLGIEAGTRLPGLNLLPAVRAGMVEREYYMSSYVGYAIPYAFSTVISDQFYLARMAGVESRDMFCDLRDSPFANPDLIGGWKAEQYELTAEQRSALEGHRAVLDKRESFLMPTYRAQEADMDRQALEDLKALGYL